MEFSKQQIVEYIQSAIHARTGDDLERARNAFGSRSTQGMQEEYGCSGETCQEILDGYEKERALATAAMRWVIERAQPPPSAGSP